MYRTYCAQPVEKEEILGFLEARGRLENAWLIREVADTLDYGFTQQEVVACRHDGELTGVAWIMHQDRVAPGYRPSNDYDVRIDAADTASLEALIEWMPSEQLGGFWLFWPMIRHHFAGLPDVTCRPGDPYFTVSPERFRSVAGEEVVRVTAADAALFEGCERQPHWEHVREDHPIYAILQEGRAASSVGTFPLTPRAHKPRVIGISGLYTETSHRRRGFGGRLISHVTRTILSEGDLPMYWSEPENAASQGLAKSLGYWQFGEYVRCFWRKPAGEWETTR